MSCRGQIGVVIETGSSGGVSSFQWRIPGFLSLGGGSGDWYHSPPFNGCGVTWMFRMHPKGLWPGSSSDEVGIVLFASPICPPLNIRVTLGIRGTEGVQNRKGRCHEFEHGGDACIWKIFCRRSQLSKEKSRLMQGDDLIITLDMKTEGSIVSTDTCTQTEEDEIVTEANQSLEKKDTCAQTEVDEIATKKGVEEWQKSLLKLLEGGKESDVIIKVKNKEFPAHRVLLRARSAVFEAMFDHDMVEKQSGVVTMEDCDPDTFPDFLKYVYSGCADLITPKNVFHLYSVSDKYDLNSLKEQCADFMKKNLTVASFSETIALAVKYGEKELIDLATEFFCANTLEVAKTVEWQTFMVENPTVGNELFMLSYSRIKLVSSR